tara:strand:+ start:1293 stop:1673 length:381 start_codon:yes stop_codon:yes gene_type:complete
MNKLILLIIIFSAGFSFIAEAQTTNKNVDTEILTNEKPKHAMDTSTIMVEYNSEKNVVHNRSNDTTRTIQFYRVPEKNAGKYTTHPYFPAQQNAISNSKSTELKYVYLKKVSDSVKIEDKDVVKHY